GLLLVLVAAAAAFAFLRPKGQALAAVAPGTYSGTAEGVLGANDQSALMIWKTQAGVFALFGKEGCRASPVGGDGRFACGELKFRLSASKIDGSFLEGSLEEEGWDTHGTWRVK